MNNNTARKPFSNVFSILRDRSGNVLPMAAVGTVVLAGLVGGGVDVSRGYMVQNRLQNACDAGVLAGRRAIDTNGFDTNAETRANNYFNTNFDASESGVTNTVFTPTSPDNGNTITATASATLDTTVMAIFNYDAMPLSVTCSAAMSVGNSDVMMVLDVTGSMGGSRITALRDAMKSFYDTVDSATSGSNARVRYGFVPYSMTVNVGSLIRSVNPDYLADKILVQSKDPTTKEVTVNELTGYGDPIYDTDTTYGKTEKGSWSNYDSNKHSKKNQCTATMPSNTPWVDDGTPSSESDSEVNSDGEQVVTETTIQPESRTKFRCKKKSGKWRLQSRLEERDREDHTVATSIPIYTSTTETVFDKYVYRQREFDTSSYKNFNSTSIVWGDDGAMESFTWNGCIEERKTVAQSSFSWSSLTGLSPSDAMDLDIDSAPDTSDIDTQWKPLWSGVGYYRDSDDDANSADEAYDVCPNTAQKFTSMSETEFDNYADSLSVGGNTYHNIGMIWGARLASPDGIFASNVNENPSNGGAVARHLIFMTDGEMQPYTLAYSSYGVERHDKRVTGDGSTDHAERHTARFLAACEIAKAKGIRVWVIAFGADMTDDLVSCASAESDFTATNSSQLNAAFQEIAKDVGELRITQ